MKYAPLQCDVLKSLASNYVIFTRRDLYEIKNYIKISINVYLNKNKS